MEKFTAKYGTWALVAGAAEGLGEAFSRALAGRGMSLLMVDHQEERMESLGRQLEADYGINTRCLALDLADEGAASTLNAEAAGLDCRLLIYNAAYSRVKPFLNASPDELDTYIDVNCRTPLKLVHGFAASMAASGRQGGILLMSSLAGLIGMQLVAPYAATKAFTWNLAEALHHEWAGSGIDIMACVAGATATPAYLSTEPEYGWVKPSVLDPDNVANGALNKLGKRVRYIPGCSNRLNYFILTRLMPRKMAAGMANRTMAKMYRRQKNENTAGS
jgi:short-subunit dehydrogenase